MAVKMLSIGSTKKILVESLDDRKRFCLKLNDISVNVTNDKCLHRGGPIHLCIKDSNGKKVCPWHGRPVKEVVSSEFAVIYFPRKNRLIIISDYKDEILWPVKLLTNS